MRKLTYMITLRLDGDVDAADEKPASPAVEVGCPKICELAPEVATSKTPEHVGRDARLVKAAAVADAKRPKPETVRERAAFVCRDA